MITKCWSHETEVRPTCEELLTELTAARAEYEKGVSQWAALCSGSVHVDDDSV